MNAVSTVVPAAGLSRRMGDVNKLLTPVGSFSTLLEATLTAVAATGCTDIVVVTGHQHESVSAAASNSDVRIVRNPRFEFGMGASLKAGVAAVPSRHAILIWPADMPFVRAGTVHELCRRLTPDSLVRPVYGGKPGHPVLFGSSWRGELLTIRDGEGGRQILERNSSSVTLLPVDDPGVHTDLDTPGDFRKHA